MNLNKATLSFIFVVFVQWLDKLIPIFSDFKNSVFFEHAKQFINKTQSFYCPTIFTLLKSSRFVGLLPMSFTRLLTKRSTSS